MPSEWNAASYHCLSGPQLAWGVELLQTLSLRGDETVIDAGCGSGRVTAELLRRLPRGRVLAVDLSANMLERAGETLLPEFGEGVSLVRADLAALPFSAAADGVFSSATFHWVADHDALFRSLFRATKPGGWLVAQCGGGDNLARLRGRMDELSASSPFLAFFDGWKDHRHYAGAEETAARLRSAGFANVEASLRDSPVLLKDAAEYRAYVATVTAHPHVARITDAALRDEFLDRLTERAAQDGPPFLLDYRRLNMRARKP